MRRTHSMVFALLPVCLAGCASIVSGKNQPISIETRYKGQAVVGANCELMNDKGKWFITTPGSTMIQKSYGDLAVRCEKDSYAPGLATVKSTAGMVWGNILFGGLIGLAVDAGQGAGYEYPPLLTVEMGANTTIEKTPPSTSSASDANSPQAAGTHPAQAPAANSSQTAAPAPISPSAPAAPPQTR